MRRNHDISARLLAHLTDLAALGAECSSNVDLASALRTGRSTVVRVLDLLDDEGRITRRGSGMRRRVTIVATGLTTAIRRCASPARTRPQHDAPPCAVCGDLVERKSGKYPRSCAKASCRAAIRSLAYGGTVDDVPWPVVTGEVEADFSPHVLAFRLDVRRTGGLPFSRSYGVSSAYERLPE